jgi:hypothetical protein
MQTYEDFIPKCKVTQGTTFPLLPVKCHCGKRLGSKQRLIESEIGKNLRLYEDEDLSDSDKLSKARVKMLKDLNFVRTCCKLSITLYEFAPFNDIEGDDCIVDCTYVNETSGKSENDYMGYNETEVPSEFFPLSKTVIGFDMEKYCMMINSMVTLKPVNDIKLENSSIKGNGETTYPKFPMLKAHRTHYPKLETDIDLPVF